jgi:ribonuclease T2
VHRGVWLCLLIFLAGPARADGEPAGAFDYYVFALSWAPGWCATGGEGRDAPECATGARTGFLVHGLWPQAEPDWPSWCRTPQRDPTRAESAAMADIMGSGGLAWYQWQKHGRCSGLAPPVFFAAIRTAWARFRRPDAIERITRPMRLAPRAFEAALLAANPGLAPEGVAVLCRDGRITEVRICLDRALDPIACGPSVARDCPLASVEVLPPR